MNKKELVQVLSRRLGFSIRKTIAVLDTVLNTIVEFTAQEGRCLCGGHNFHLRKCAERRGRNPNTGEKLTIPERRVVTYRRVLPA